MTEEEPKPNHSVTRLRRTGKGSSTEANAGDTTAEEQAFLMGEADEAAPEPHSDEGGEE